MTLEEKIEHLQNASMEEARSQGNSIIEEHQNALQQIFEDHKEAALRQAELSIKIETNNARQQLNKALAKSQTELKRAQGKCQTILKNKLFDRVRTLLNDYMRTPQYTDLLLSYIQKAKNFAGTEQMTVYLNPSDEGLKDKLEHMANISLVISKKEFMGGIRAVIHERNILIDHSFASAIASEYDSFLFSGTDKVERKTLSASHIGSVPVWEGSKQERNGKENE